MAIQTVLDYSTWFRRQLDTGKLVPCVRECRNLISNMSGQVCMLLDYYYCLLPEGLEWLKIVTSLPSFCIDRGQWTPVKYNNEVIHHVYNI